MRDKVKSRDLLIVDGYNFIFSFFKSEDLNNENLTYLREKLIEDLIWYKSQKDCDVIVVFDARDSSKISRSAHIIDDVKVIFSKRGRTADDVIEGLVSKNTDYKRIFVVTSDYLQQQVIFRKNIYRKSIREFNIEMKKRL